MPKTNTRIARGIGTSTPDQASWAAFDALPRRVRLALWQASVSINPLSAQMLLENGGTDYALKELANASQSELAMFSAEYRQRFGQALPHVAAWVTVQAYQQGSGSSRPRRRPVSSRAARWTAVQSVLP